MKKHTLVLLLISVLALILCTSCGTKSENGNSKTSKTTKTTTTTAKEPVTDTNETEITSIDKALATESAIEYDIPDRQIIDRTNDDIITTLDAYNLVLTNQTPLIDSYDNTSMLINQLITSLADNWTLKDFAIIDLDNNGLPEVILRFLHPSSNEPFFNIIRYENNKIYNFSFYNRQFQDLKVDGTFCSSGGATNHGITTISFSEKNYSTDYFTYVESTYTDLKKFTLYYVNHEPATEEEFIAAFNHQSNKPDVTWYEFSQENIEKYFPTQPD